MYHRPDHLSLTTGLSVHHMPLALLILNSVLGITCHCTKLDLYSTHHCPYIEQVTLVLTKTLQIYMWIVFKRARLVLDCFNE